jgi:hypothetical protein
MYTRTRRTSTRPFLFAVATVTAMAVAAAAQPSQQPEPASDRKVETKKLETKKNVVVVRGCVSASTLTHTDAREYATSVPDPLKMTGSRAVRGALKEAEGHTVEVTGTLKGVKNQASGALVKDTGKTKIYVGGTERRTGQERMMDEQRNDVATLDVTSVKDIAPQCGQASQ